MFLDLTPVDYLMLSVNPELHVHVYQTYALTHTCTCTCTCTCTTLYLSIYSWFTFLEVSSDSQLLIKWFYSGRYVHMHVTWNGYSWVNLEILVLQMAQLLITKGAHLNAGDRKDRKPLHWAAHMGKSCTMYLYMQFNLLVRFGQR